jgi:Domain of unknown function (DUF4917)
MTRLITFDQAIADSEQFSKRHLLLGNGFSIACKPNIFHYASLFSRADFSQIPEVQKVFETLETQDFEIAIKALESTGKILPIYAPTSPESADKAMEHAKALKDILISTIAANHPGIPSEIPDEKFWACRKFLSNFLAGNKRGYVFTLNYDLLLYWTLMHEDDPNGDQYPLQTNDSFGNDENDPYADYVVWQGETKAHDAKVFFLHGALHLFDSGSELKKYTWIRNGNPLVTQAREAIDANFYPLFVAEGTTEQKKNKIRHNAYLYQGLKQLSANTPVKTHCFFIFGHSLADNDDHILKHFAKGKFPKLYVGIFGDVNSDANQAIIRKAERLKTQRDERNPLEVVFYDAASAKVWG